MITFLMGTVIIGAILLFWFCLFPNSKKPVAVRSPSEQKLHFKPGEFEIQSRVLRRMLVFSLVDCRSGMKYSMRLIRSPRLTESFDVICTVHPKWGGRVLRIQYLNNTKTMLEWFLQINYLFSSGLLAFTFLLIQMDYSVVNMYFGGMTFLFSIASYIYGINQSRSKGYRIMMVLSLAAELLIFLLIGLQFVD